MKLSICVPTYNRSQLIVDTINNITDVCKDVDYELIIVDDCSSDDTIERIKEVYESLPEDIQVRIKTYRNEENIGVTKSWNILVDYAIWDYICVINNDVIFPHWFFEKLMSWFEDGVGMIFPRFTEWDSTNPTDIKYFKNNIAGHCFMFKQEQKNEFFPLDERLIIFGSDNWLYLRVRELWYKFKVMANAICHHLKSQTVFFVPNIDMDMFHFICDQEWWNTGMLGNTTNEELLDDLIF